jgi:hypothetical protein
MGRPFVHYDPNQAHKMQPEQTAVEEAPASPEPDSPTPPRPLATCHLSMDGFTVPTHNQPAKAVHTPQQQGIARRGLRSGTTYAAGRGKLSLQT